jgi:hypothetical protein
MAQSARRDGDIMGTKDDNLGQDETKNWRLAREHFESKSPRFPEPMALGRRSHPRGFVILARCRTGRLMTCSQNTPKQR